jgi:hypothetical protein
MGQISRALTLWACDNTLTIALEVSKALMAHVEYLMSLWPCNSKFIFACIYYQLAEPMIQRRESVTAGCLSVWKALAPLPEFPRIRSQRYP